MLCYPPPPPPPPQSWTRNFSHLIDNAKMFKVFKSKITKSQIASQWAIRMPKKAYILKD